MIKKIAKEDLMDFVEISMNAYPAFASFSKEDKDRMLENFTKIQDQYETENLYGVYRNNALLGGMNLHDFTMNFQSQKIKAGGLGSVAVHYLHKKEKVAKELVEFYLHHYRNKNINLACLYPFRTDFYRKMGFGYGTKMNHYKLKPVSFPQSDLRKNIVFLTEEDKEDLINCYQEFVNQHHGMMDMNDYDKDKLFKNPKLKVVGYKKDNALLGYVFFGFKNEPGNFLVNDMIIYQFIYNTRDALMGILSFFQSQLDQIRYVVFNTQDESLHHLFVNPVNDSNRVIPHVYHESNVQGIGLMYRVLNVPGLFKELKDYNFNQKTCLLKITISDDFLPENNASTIIHFKEGYPSIVEEETYDVEIKLNITQFSSLIMGVVDFKSLYLYSLADISDTQYMELVDAIFHMNEKPMCTTGF